MKLSYFQATIGDFLGASTDSVLGELSKEHAFALDLLQKRAWLRQISLLKPTLEGFDSGMIFFEFAIPRMGKRADLILVLQDKIIVLEFKVGATLFDRGAIEQVHDYTLDLKNFHTGSHDAPPPQRLSWAKDEVAQPLLANDKSLRNLLLTVDAYLHGPPIVPLEWSRSGYRPTPTGQRLGNVRLQGHYLANHS
jgi:hypothetical protein